MKLNKFLFVAIAAALLSACSSDDTTSGDKKPGGNGFSGDGYIAVKINLPTQSASAFRAINDDFNDGSANEYQVNNAALILFSGSNEASATFQGVYDLSLAGNTNTPPENDNITSTYNKAVKVENVSLNDGEELYGLVMVNYDNVITIKDNEMYIDDSKFSGTFGELRNKEVTKSLKSSDYNFFMTNAPLSSVAGGSNATAPAFSNVKTLVVLTGGLKNTEADALKAPAGTVYVERAVAKATLSANNVQVGVKDNNSNNMTVNVEWTLGNTEESSYIVRNLGKGDYISYKSENLTTTNYRFVGASAMKAGANLYRTYWCIDPAYTNNKTYNEVDESNFIAAGSAPLYCHENTFSVENQNYKNTTRAVIKVTFNGGTFYTVNGDLTTAYTEEDAKSYVIKAAAEDARIKELLETNLNANESIDDYTLCVKTTFSKNASDKVVTLSDLSIDIPDGLKSKFSNTEITLDDATKNSIIASANGAYKLVEYTDGVSYYDLRFMHFASDNTDADLAPLPADFTGETTSAVYGTNAENYLGRYGMVRNNWYDVKVTKINNIGSPVIPNADIEKSDDNKSDEKWIAFELNVLSWAMRTQNHEF